ncbi:MAG: transposase family protein [Nitrosomonas sp.]|nr:transposase family protein [Nitrosomonas sp.]
MPEVPSGSSGKDTVADELSAYTRSFERLVLDLSGHMTIQAVARHLRSELGSG